jgi:hypothetical protein
VLGETVLFAQQQQQQQQQQKKQLPQTHKVWGSCDELMVQPHCAASFLVMI